MRDDESHSNDKLLCVVQVSEICTFSVRKIWRDVAAQAFPRPIKLGPKTTRWWKSDILHFLRGDRRGPDAS